MGFRARRIAAASRLAIRPRREAHSDGLRNPSYEGKPDGLKAHRTVWGR